MFHSCAGFKDFFRGKGFAGNACGHVGYAGDSQNANAGVAGGENFWNGGHAYQIGSERAKGMNFGRRLVIGTSEGEIDALMKAEFEFFPASATKRRNSGS